MRRLAILLLWLAAALPGLAQDEGFLPSLVEQKLSGEGRTVRLRGVTGLLSAKATIEEITVADSAGVWLRIGNARIDWKRGDLLAGKLTVSELAAETIEVLRGPQADPDLPLPEARGWAVPELPVAVDIGALSVGELRLAAPVIGLEARLRGGGAMRLAEGNLTASLDVVRLDGNGGSAEMDVSYLRASDIFDIGLQVLEPPDGVIANALNLHDRPAVGLSLQGTGPVGGLDLTYDLQTGGERRVFGQAFLRRRPEGLAFSADFDAGLAALVAPQYRAIFADPVRVAVSGVTTVDGVMIDKAELAAAGMALALDGVWRDGGFTGALGVETDSLARFSALLGREVGGSGKIGLRGMISPLAGSFDLVLGGSVQDVVPGAELAARLLRGSTQLSGRLSRDARGLTAQGLRLQGERVDVLLDGAVSSATGAMTAVAELQDLGDLHAALGGGGRVEATVTADAAGPLISALVAVPEGAVAGRELRGMEAALQGRFAVERFDGNIAATANLDGAEVSLNSLISAGSDGAVLREAVARVAGAELAGAVEVTAAGLASGALTLAAADPAPLAAVFGQEVTGRFSGGTVTASHDGARQDFAANLRGAGLAYGGVSAVGIRLRAEVADAYAAMTYRLQAASDSVAATGVTLANVSASLGNASGVPRFDLAAKGGGGEDFAASGSLQPQGSGWRIGLDAASVSGGAEDLRLREPVAAVYGESALSLDRAVIVAGAGEAVLSGRIGTAMQAEAVLRDFPAGASALLLGDKAPEGAVSGRIGVAGTAADLDVEFDLRARDASQALWRSFGQQDVDLSAKGVLQGNVLRLQALQAVSSDFLVSAAGALPLAGAGADLKFTLARGNLAAIDAAGGRFGLAGQIMGSGRMTGRLAVPVITYDLSGAGLTTAALQAAGIAAFSGTASGELSAGELRLGPTNLTGSGGFGLAAEGNLSLAGGPLAVQLRGSLPLALANGVLASRGAQADGRLVLALQAGGTLAQPDLRGEVSLAGGTFTDAASNLRLEDLALQASFSGASLVISSGSARSSAGGRMEISGKVGLSGGTPVPDLVLRLTNLAYADGRTVATRLSGDLALRGPLDGGAVLTGALVLGETQIVIPSGSGGGTSGGLPEVRHRGQSAAVQATLDRVDQNRSQPGDALASNVAVDLSVTAPGRVFLRGRGLDSELRGGLRLTGTLGNVVPVGSFEMVRGRLALLGQRFDFRQGRVTLEGNLDPVLDFRAESQSGETAVIVTVSGSASDPEIGFSSSPELPQDEVLALMIFNRNIAELSPFQLVQLASAVGTLTGGRDDGLFAQLRGAAGLDDLDIETAEDGSTAVRAGKYIEENIYLEIEGGSDGTSKATINLDLSGHVTAKASTGSDGESEVGVFYERDY